MFVFFPVHRGIHAQYQQVYPSPNGTFKFMKFEWMNRGGYNISTCLKDLMNCWEVMRCVKLIVFMTKIKLGHKIIK